ncbi:unnamed protein product, partial [Coccothraustes coccothraustes]
MTEGKRIQQTPLPCSLPWEVELKEGPGCPMCHPDPETHAPTKDTGPPPRHHRARRWEQEAQDGAESGGTRPRQRNRRPRPAAPGTGASPAGKTTGAGRRRRGAGAAAPHPSRSRPRQGELVGQKSPHPSMPGGEAANLPRDGGWRRRTACTCFQGAQPS